MPWVRDADVLLVDGGEAVYLAHWMRESGLADLMPELTGTVWVGVSAGSMVMTPSIGDWFADQSVATLTVGLPVVVALLAAIAAFPGIRRVVP